MNITKLCFVLWQKYEYFRKKKVNKSMTFTYSDLTK